LLPKTTQTTGPVNDNQMKGSTSDKSSGASSSFALSPANHQSIAIVLPQVGFHWDHMKRRDEIETQSYAISFDVEWKQFIELVGKIAGTNLNKKAAICENAWKCFEHVIMPTNTTNNVDLSDYEKEEVFDDALFAALRTSLSGFVDKKSEGIGEKWIVICNSHVAFGQKIGRTSLGFKAGYALSRNNISDHGCFVLGTETIKALHVAGKAKASASKVASAYKRKTFVTDEFYWLNDRTSSVEIKLERTSCQYFEAYGNEVQKPDFGGKHGPMGQAMLYSMDVWHCLARRGIIVENIPVVVLAGKSKVADKHKLCCLQAHIKIPKDCISGFVYSVDEIVAFDGTAGFSLHSANVLEKLQDSRDKRAIAIYIKTMRIGLENAMEVIKMCNMSDPLVFPVSLGCFPLLPEGSNAQLVASPIRREPQFFATSLRIHQGELFRVSKPTYASLSGFKELNWFIDSDCFSECLIKISCLTVHNTYIKHFDCEKALNKLFVACQENSDLKKSIAKVLLGFCYVTKSKTLVCIMKDLQKENFEILEHDKAHVQRSLPELWSAFCVLVQSVLLPMAKKDIIHHDIRSSKECTCNILICNENGKIELRLIDFESLILYDSALDDDDLVKHNDAVHVTDLYKTVGNGVEWNSAYRYLFWQVLWIAYRWHIPPGSVLESKENQSKLIARDFVLFFLSDVEFNERKGHYRDYSDFGEFKE
jgi:hypothetical protein